MIRKLLLLVKLLFTIIFTEKSFIPSVKLLCLGMFFVVSFANAATRYSVNNGNWNSTATWSTSAGGGSGASVPVAGDVVYIDGNSITVTADAACTSITFRGNINTLTINSGVSLTLATTAAGTIIYESSASSSRSTTITGGGTLNCTSLTVGSNVNPNAQLSTSITSTISNLNITGNLTLDSRRSGGNTVNAAFYLQSGILNLDGQIITTNEHSSNTSTFSMASGAQSGTLLISNTTPFSLSGTGGSTVALNGTSSTVNYDGVNQTVRSTAYTNLTLSNGGTKTFAAALAITNLLSISTNTVAALGSFQHTAGILTLGGAGPLTSTWGHTNSNPVAANTNNTFFAAANTGRITVAGAPYPAIDNNYASYGITGQITGVRGENDGVLTLTAPDGTVFINVKFASYGLPGGTSPNFTIGSCHAFNSRTVTTGLLGNTSATIPASGAFNDTFGDPCFGIVKNYYVVATYAKPICSGTTPSTIIGSDPSGGNGSYSYLWEVSTTSAIAGYTTAPGVSTGRDYTIPSTISQKTWYRRTVTSGIYSDPTIVVIPVNTTSEISAPTSATSSSSTVCSGNAITLTAVGGSFGSAGGYAEWTTGSCSGPVVGTSALPGGALTLTPTGNATYYVKYKNSCGSTTCASVSVNNPTSVTLTNSNYSTCFNSTLAQNRSINYSATTGSPTSFSIDWDTAANTAGIADRTNIANTFVATPSIINNAIVVPANTPAGTYTGILTVRTGTCVSFGNTITITVNALPTPTFTVQPTASPCIGTSVTYTTQGSMSNYVWGLPGTAGTNYTVVSGGSNADNSVTLRYLTTGSKTVTINYTNVSDGCTAASATSSSAVTVNALPTPTFIAQPTALTCIGTAVTYTTQAAMSNYVWGFPGTAGTDYTIVSGGTSADNTVTLRYLTAGSKTVTINYTNVPNSCTATSATSSSATTVNALPTPTFTAQPAASTCIGTSVTYTTQGAMSNYVWGFPGTAGTDYTIVSGGTSADNTVTLRYLTAGSKTVTINYTNVPNSCTATSATSSSATTVNALPTPTFTAQPAASTCIGTSVTYTTQVSMSNYLWGLPGVAGTDYAIISGGTSNDSSVTLRYLTTGSKTVTINYTTVPNSCTATSATSSSATTVNALPTPTFTAQPAASTCIGTSVTYTTQGAMSNYVWGFPGTAGTNYTIVSGGTSADNTVTLRYLTTGSKTVTINYTTVPNSCTATSATSSSATTVNALPTPTFTAQPAGSTCIGTSVIYTTQAAMSNYVWGFPGTAGTDYTIVSGGTNADNTVTLRYLTAGSKTVTINYTTVPNGCTATSATSSSAITVNALPTTPSIAVQTEVNCTTSGSVTLNNLPAGNWTINQTGFVSNTINNTGTSYTVTGLAAGTYRFTVSNGTCTSSVSSDVTILDQSSTTWSGTAWSNGTPDASKAAIIAGAFTIASDLTTCSLTINPGIAITVPSNYTLRVVNALTVSPTASLTFENHSSLVQVNDNAVNSGNIKYKRIAPKIRRGDFVYWSTPVSPQKLIDVSPLTLGDKYFGYSGDNWVITNKNTVMKVGKGYIIRGPQTYSLTVKADYPAEFNGVPNNGVILGETLTAGKPYLIGNPYPSALSAKKFLDQNTAILEGTLYFWTHNTPVTLTGAYTYTSDDYASYNLTGSTVVKERAITGGTPGSNNEEPSGFIGAGQSFFATSKAGGTVTFNNDMRLGAADNTQFFKSASKETTDAHHVWLNMTNTKGVFKQMLVGYVQGATNEYEDRYDGVSFNANPYVDFYSVDNGNNYVIQGRALPFTDTDQVPLGYNTTITGDFTISIDKTDGDLSSHAIYLEDKKTGVIHDLTASDYTFTTEKGTFTDRLVLRYTNKTLGTGDFENIENGLLVSVKDKTIRVTSSAENIKEVTVFDISGKLLYSKKKAGTTELQIQNLQSSNQVLLVKVTLDNDFTATKKIIFN